MLFVLTPESYFIPRRLEPGFPHPPPTSYHLPYSPFTIQNSAFFFHNPTYYPSLSCSACQETQSRFPLSGPNLPPADSRERAFPGPRVAATLFSHVAASLGAR
jgi:hypothetical protein